MMSIVHRSFATFVLLAGIAVSFEAQGADPPNVAKAREIALEAGDAVDAKKYQEALDKISEAEAMYHAPTHMLIRAEALEGLGRLVEALDTYENLAAEPLSPTAPAPFRQAREDGRKRQIALIARVPSLLVLVSGPESSEVVAMLDGKPLPLASDQATRCEPGKHRLHVEAKGYRTIEREVELAERGGVVKLNLHLEKEQAQGAPPPPPPPPPSPPVPKGRTLVVPAVVSLAVGGISLGIGATTGVMSLSRANKLKSECAADGRCPPEVGVTINQGRLLGNISTGTFVVGGAALGAGVVLLIVGKPKSSTTGWWRSTLPWVGPGTIGLGGTF